MVVGPYRTAIKSYHTCIMLISRFLSGSPPVTNTLGGLPPPSALASVPLIAESHTVPPQVAASLHVVPTPSVSWGISPPS